MQQRDLPHDRGRHGFFQHGHTYLGHPVAAAAGLAVVSATLDRGLAARVREMGNKLDAALQSEFGQDPNAGDIRGRGLFRGIELVENRETKTPFDPSMRLAAKIKAAAMENVLTCYPMAGTIDGRSGDHILLAPPYIIEDIHIDELAPKLKISISRALAS